MSSLAPKSTADAPARKCQSKRQRKRRSELLQDVPFLFLPGKPQSSSPCIGCSAAKLNGLSPDRGRLRVRASRARPASRRAAGRRRSAPDRRRRGPSRPRPPRSPRGRRRRRRAGACSARRRPPCRAGGQRDPLVQLDELRQREQRMAGIALDLGLAGHVAEHEEVRRAAVDQPERDAGVRRMGDRALALDEQQLAAALVTLDDEPLGRAGDEVGDDRVDGDPPARDRDPGLAGRDEARLRARAPAPRGRARARRSSSRSRSPSRPSARSCAGTVRFAPVGTFEVGGRLAQVAELDAVPRRELGQLRVVGEELVQAVLEVEPLRDAALQQLAPRGREASALGRDADERGRRAEAERVVDGRRRSGCRRASPPRASSRGSRRPARRRTRARRARSCRSADRPSEPSARIR